MYAIGREMNVPIPALGIAAPRTAVGLLNARGIGNSGPQSRRAPVWPHERR